MMNALLKSVQPRIVVMAMGGAFLLFAAALVSYGVWPELAKYRQSQQTLKTFNQTLHNGNSIGDEIKRMESEVTQLNRNLHGDLRDLPESQMGSYLIGRLQEISWKNHIRLLGVRPGTGSTLGKLEEIPFTVEVSGDYFDLYAWAQDLAKDLGFLAISHFNISLLNSSDGSSDVKASFTIVSYRETNNG